MRRAAATMVLAAACDPSVVTVTEAGRTTMACGGGPCTSQDIVMGFDEVVVLELHVDGDLPVDIVEIGPMPRGIEWVDPPSVDDRWTVGPGRVDLELVVRATAYRAFTDVEVLFGDGSMRRFEPRVDLQRPSVGGYPHTLDFGETDPGATRVAYVVVDNGQDRPGDFEIASTNPDLEIVDPVFTLRSEEVREVPVFWRPRSDRQMVSDVTISVGGYVAETVRLQGNNCVGGLPAAYDRDADGFTTCGGDCDDFDPDVNPAAPETPNGVDDDCDDVVDELGG